MTLLVVIIMILLSIILGMAWKHLEQLRNLRGHTEKISNMFNNDTVENSTNKIVDLLENKVCMLINTGCPRINYLLGICFYLN